MIKEKVKTLWRHCFDDSDEFIDMYFRLRYSNEVNIAIKSGEEVVTALQMLPYPMTFGERIIQTSYISGACTHPDYQGNGMMRELLAQAFARMLHNGSAVSTLIPGESWLFDYYTRMGYAPVFRYSRTEITAVLKQSTDSGISVRSMTEYEEEVYLYLNRELTKRPYCIQHTVADFKVILADLAVTHDTLYVATQEEKVVGIAVTYREGKCLRIGELLADSQKITDDFLYQIQQGTGCNNLVIITPPAKDTESYPLGMARIINARAVLQCYAAAYPEANMNIELTDKQLSVNNGYYYVNKGKCMFNKQRLPDSHIQVSIGELSEMILSPLHPYMSLMMN